MMVLIQRICQTGSTEPMAVSSYGAIPKVSAQGYISFSKSFFNIKNMISAPWCNSRGSDTVLLLKWLSWFLSLHLEHPVLPNNGGHSGTMRIMLETIKAARTILFLIRQHRLFCIQRVAGYCMSR